MKTAKRIFYVRVEQEDLLCDGCKVPVIYEDMQYQKLPWWNIWTPPALEYYIYKCPLCGGKYTSKESYPKIHDEVIQDYD